MPPTLGCGMPPVQEIKKWKKCSVSVSPFQSSKQRHYLPAILIHSAKLVCVEKLCINTSSFIKMKRFRFGEFMESLWGVQYKDWFIAFLQSSDHKIGWFYNLYCTEMPNNPTIAKPIWCEHRKYFSVSKNVGKLDVLVGSFPLT